jgi:hypothetical protein
MQYARCLCRQLCGVLKVRCVVMACLRLLTISLSKEMESSASFRNVCCIFQYLDDDAVGVRRRGCLGVIWRAFTRFVLACLVDISLELAQQGTDGGLSGCCVGGGRLVGSLGHIWESDTWAMQWNRRHFYRWFVGCDWVAWLTVCVNVVNCSGPSRPALW